MRLRDCRISTINKFFRKAIEQLLDQLKSRDPLKIKPLADAYFDSEDGRTAIYEILARYQLDNSAIIAEATSLSKDQLEQLDKMLASARARLDRSLRSIQEYRVSFIGRVRDSTDKIVQAKDAPSIQPNRLDSV